jgi:hypothetical protein
MAAVCTRGADTSSAHEPPISQANASEAAKVAPRDCRTGTTHAQIAPMQALSLPLPPLLVVRGAVAAVWLYEGLWCKVLGREPHQVRVVEAVPRLGPLVGRPFLVALGLVETTLAAWVVSGIAPGLCAIVQVVLLVALNVNGLLWARHIIHDPGGMVVKNIAFLLLAWIAAVMSGGPS